MSKGMKGLSLKRNKESLTLSLKCLQSCDSKGLVEVLLAIDCSGRIAPHLLYHISTVTHSTDRWLRSGSESAPNEQGRRCRLSPSCQARQAVSH
jgi:hypothetical protein